MKGIQEMKIFSSKKRIGAIGAVAALTLVGGGVAYGYWTTTGSGTGTATAGTTQAITVSGATTGTVAPGGPAVTVTFKASNPATFNQKLTTIHLDSVTTDTAHSTCALVLGTDFSMADVTVGAEGNLAASASDVDLTATGSFRMLDSGVSQDGCKGAPLTLHFTTS